MTPWPATSVAIILVLLVVLPGLAIAKSPKLPPPSVGEDPQSWANRDGWYLRLGAPQRDTLSTSPSAALLAARAALENDRWELETTQEGGQRLTTQWKVIHGFLFHLFSGTAFGRCFVSALPLSDDRVEVTFQGGLATRRDIEHNPMRGLAERSYLSAARVWQQEVRALLANPLSGRDIGGEK